jgi:hypothetical protein
MTMPIERTRALRWGWELLSTVQQRPDIPEDLRVRAATIDMTNLGDDLRHELLVVLRHYPSPGEVRAAAQNFFLGIGSWLATES